LSQIYNSICFTWTRPFFTAIAVFGWVSALLDVGLQESLVGVILYSGTASIHFDLLEYTNKVTLLSAINPGIPYLGGGTNTAGALTLLLSSAQNGRLGLRNGRTHLAVVITDGASDSPLSTQIAANQIHSANIFDEVYAVGVGGADVTELNRIATNPSSVLFTHQFDAAVIRILRRNLTTQLCESLGRCLIIKFKLKKMLNLNIVSLLINRCWIIHNLCKI